MSGESLHAKEYKNKKDRQGYNKAADKSGKIQGKRHRERTTYNGRTIC